MFTDTHDKKYIVLFLLIYMEPTISELEVKVIGEGKAKGVSWRQRIVDVDLDVEKEKKRKDIIDLVPNII